MDFRQHCVFVTGGKGYVVRPLITLLLDRGHGVRALVLPGSEKKLPPGCQAVLGDAVEGNSCRTNPARRHFRPTGRVSHPNPSKAAEFRSVDLVSGRDAVQAARGAGIGHFTYLSVGQPAPGMKAYIQVRAECGALLRATILRPWYVLGPRHRWLYLLFRLAQGVRIVEVPQIRVPGGFRSQRPSASQPDHPQTKVTAGITKAHAHGTSVRCGGRMRW
jgi:nucleoside-diphosphate-sugar epimerase